jgi:ElaB/YqjD/DUF883 family membrane-anchored ribosome-binding protein
MADQYGIENSARNTAGKIQDAVNDMAGDAATKLRNGVNRTADRMQDRAAVAADEMRGLGDQLAVSVKEQPLMSLLIAGGIGIVLGFLARR